MTLKEHMTKAVLRALVVFILCAVAYVWWAQQPAVTLENEPVFHGTSHSAPNWTWSN